MKKFTFSALLAIMFTTVALPVMAETNDVNTVKDTATNQVQIRKNEGKRDEVKIIREERKAKKVAIATCVKTALETRNVAIKTAQAKYNTDLKAAVDARKVALDSAKALTEKESKKDAVKAAQKTFKDAKSVAKKAWRDAREVALEAGKTAREVCKK